MKTNSSAIGLGRAVKTLITYLHVPLENIRITGVSQIPNVALIAMPEIACKDTKILKTCCPNFEFPSGTVCFLGKTISVLI